MSQARLVLAFGGRSSEHEISIRSATEVLAAIDRSKFEIVLLGLRRDGGWRTGSLDTPLAEVLRSGTHVHALAELQPDVVFSVLHGPQGEDGAFQGLLEVHGVPYVGSGVLASALCMDKVRQKQLLQAAAPDIPLLAFLTVETGPNERVDAAFSERVGHELGYPCFVKPANMGSSVGVSKVASRADLDDAIRVAASYDRSVVLERGLTSPREIEVAVLGNGDANTSVSMPGEIVLPPGVWYDYDTKYVHDVAKLQIPAELPRDTIERIRRDALLAFRVLGCTGMARIDFLLDRSDMTPYLNELNTLPGFTSISMYPKLMAHAGVPYQTLITRLCELAFERHLERGSLSIER